MKFKNFLRRNYFVVIVFSFALSLFIIQHSSGLSWDFITYVLNARYYLTGFNSYFELFRPPLASILMLFGGASLFSEYFYIIFVALLHLFSCYKLCKEFKLDLRIFYSAQVTPFLLSFGLFAGTELLSLSLIQLLIAYMNKPESGFFLGLASLTRYTNFTYAFTLFFKKNLKQAFIALVISLLVFSPWLFFNWLKFGDPLLSMVDQYANNIGLRDYLMKPPSLAEFFIAFNYSIVLMPLALYFVFRNHKRVARLDLIMLLSLIFELYSFVRIPLRNPRYLFIALMPCAYFITRLFQSCRKFINKAPYVLFFATLSFMPYYLPYFTLTDARAMNSVLLSVDDCMIMSNGWVYINYLGRSAEPFPRDVLVENRINEGYRILLFTGIGEPDYVYNSSFMSQFSILSNDTNYYLLGDSSLCRAPYAYDIPYLRGLNKTFVEAYGYEFSYTIWDIIG